MIQNSNYDEAFKAAVNFSFSSLGLKTPNSVTIPPVMSSAGATSKAGFHTPIPVWKSSKEIRILFSDNEENILTLGGYVFSVNASELIVGSLFNDNIITSRKIEINWGTWSNDVEWNVVILGYDWQLIRSDLVGGVSVRHDTISANRHGWDSLQLHCDRRHVIADQCRGNVVVDELVSGQSSTLVVGTCLSAEAVLQKATLMQTANNSYKEK